MKTITFLMPMRADMPSGGYKIVYEYANMFEKNGYNVNIVYPAILLFKENSFILNMKFIRDFLVLKKTKEYLPYKWFNLNKSVKNIWIPYINSIFIPKSDYIVATAWQTAELMNKFSERKGKKIYLIQGFEDFSGNKDRVINTWKMKFNKVVIAKWLKKIADDLGEETEIINNPLNFNEFGVDKKIEERANTIIMMYSEHEWKDSDVGIKAIKKVTEIYKDLKVIFFSSYKRNKSIPEWVEYYENPKRELLRKLYNESVIYIGTSKREGWGLPVSEAMQCGCSVVCTDIDGYNEVAFDNDTALLVPAGDSDKMAEKILELLEDREKMIKIAKRGNENIQKYRPEEAFKSFEAFLNKLK